MKGIMKKIISMILAVALVVTGLNYVPGPETVKAATTVTGTGYSAEISTGKATFSDTMEIEKVTYNNYVRYGASILDKSGEDSGSEATKMIDNNSSTRWAHASSGDSGYITVDLGAAYSINYVYINWEVANAKKYAILYSHNGTNFTEAVTIENTSSEASSGGNRIDKVTLTSELKCRYVRIQVKERCSTNYGGVSIWELGIYGMSDKAKNIVWDNSWSGCWGDWKTVFGSTDGDSGATYNNYLGYSKYRSATASVDGYSGSHVPANAFDGKDDTRWANEATKDGHWITVDLGAEYNIRKLCISWEVAQPSIYNIEVSNDGVNFDTAATVNIADDTDNTANNSKNRVDKITLSENVKAQYIRIYTLKRYNSYGMSIWELGIYGPDSEIDENVFETKAYDGYSTTSGVEIQAENFSSDISYAVGRETSNIGHTVPGSYAGYKVHFDRNNTTQIKFRYSAANNAVGDLKVYVDSMSGSPVATLRTSSTGSWSTWREDTISLADGAEIPQGDHKIYLVMEPDTANSKKYVCNLDYFQCIYEPVDAVGTHEAEDAHAYEIGDASSMYAIKSNDTFSGGNYVGNLNTASSSSNPSYMTTYINVDYTGTYRLKIAYATDTDTNIEYRANNGSWSSVSAASSGNWWTPKEIVATEELTLTKGINKIDITGARQDDSDWVNLDYFIIERVSYNKTAFNERNTTLTGNTIQAESFDENNTVEAKDGGTGRKIGNTKSGSWAEYDIYFDRRPSEIVINRANPSGYGGNIEVYMDDMSGTPIATVNISDNTGDWNTFSDVSANITLATGTIPNGLHKIYLKFVPADGYTDVADVDYFKFKYAPEDVEINNEAEKAHVYIQGASSDEATVETNDTFSNNAAIKKMDTWASDDRAYLTTYVNAKHAGTYKLTVAYATSNSTTTQVSYRVNGTDDSSWKELDAPGTGTWYDVKTITTEVTLNKGINIIDITGARNTWENGKAWEYINFDYFRLDRVVDETNLAYGKDITSGDVQSGFDAENAIDEDTSTRWAANSTSDSWFTVDLDGLYEIEEIEILFERAYASDFEILFSRDGETWVTTRKVTNFNDDADIGSGNTITWNSTSTEGTGNPNYGCLGKTRYVKFKATEMGANYDKASIHEFVVRGEKIPGYLSNVVLTGTATASSNDSTDPPSYAIDVDNSTRWTSPKSDANPYLTVDLGRICELYTVDLTFERAYAKSFKIQVSADGEKWTDAYTVTDWQEMGAGNAVNTDAYKNKILGYSLHLNQEQARYVRFYTDAKNKSDWGVSIWEFEVWGRDLSKEDYWTNVTPTDYGIYPVDGLYDLTTAADGTSMGDTSLVQNDVIAFDDTYEVVYEPNKELYFYANPYSYSKSLYINLDTDQVCWSSQSSGSNQWGADHSESIAKYVTQNGATVQYILPEDIEFGDADYVETEIACQVWLKSDLTDNVPNDGASSKVYLKFKLRVLKSHDIYIEDSIRTDGCLHVRDAVEGTKYVWQKSTDGENWETVNEKRYDLTIINDDGASVNVAMDLGGGQYYRVKVSGAEEWSQPYHVTYYNNVQNGDFEFPAMYSTDDENAIFPFNSNGDEQQYPNGYPGLIWKTTGPGWTGGVNSARVGHDIEIVNGRHLRVDQAGQEYQFSVTLDEMYKDNSHGDQFAELNCENVGALYQDILTTPGSECYWELDHAGRWNQNTMYVVAMSSNDALTYTTKTEIAKIVELANDKNLTDTDATSFSSSTAITLNDNETDDTSDDVIAYVWKAVTDETAGVWVHHSGKYIVPEGEDNYLTRFFFVSAGGAKRNESDSANATVGNLIDNVSFEMKQSYTIEYYVDNNLIETATIEGFTVPYDRVGIPSDIQDDDTDVVLSNYTLVDAQIGGTEASSFKAFYVDSSDRKMTVAYNHNVLKLYYESGTIAVIKKIVGFSEVPDDYTFIFKLESSDGQTAYVTKTVTGTEFTAIDKVNDTDPDSCFVSFKIDVEEVEGVTFTAGNTYRVTEVVADPTVEIDGDVAGYLYNVDSNGQSFDVAISDLDKTNVSYSGTFTYSAGDNVINVVNSYEMTKKLTVTKVVTGNMGDTTKAFDFTVNLSKDDVAVPMAVVPSGVTATSTTGEYKFSLKHNDSITFTLYNECSAVITEDDYSSDYYTTTWEVKEEEEILDVTDEVAPTSSGTSASTGVITKNMVAICTNDNNDIGDVEVQGFQMNTNPEKGGVSEFNPSFRVVCRVSKNTIKRKKVVSYGVIYANFEDKLTEDTLKEVMVAKSIPEAYKDKVYVHNTTEAGVYKSWTTQDEYTEKYWDYYALTIKGVNYIYEALESDITFRAFAIMEDGSIEYGNNVFTVNMYEIADNLYQNQKISTKAGHEFLYDNVLNVVMIKNNRLDICKAMMKVLNVKSTSSEEYKLCNNVYKDMQDYVYCDANYYGTYPRYEDFAPQRIEENTLLDKLNAATGTTYETLFDWCYNQTELAGSGTYKGFYKKVTYAWDSGIYKDFTKK